MILLALLISLIIGFVSVLMKLKGNAKEIAFATEFHNRADTLFRMVLEQSQYTISEYVWLTKNSNEMQSNMGVFGIMVYIEPYNRASHPNYQIVINTVAKVGQGRIKTFDAVSCTDAIIRYIGATEAKRKMLIANSRNPFYWFTEGVKTIISTPIYLLNAFGIISDRSTAKATGSKVLTVISGIFALVGFLGSLADAVVGKDAVIKFFKDLLHR